MKTILAIASFSIALAGCSSKETSTPDSANSIPEQAAYSSKKEFLRARVEYYTSDWVQKNPDKPWHYTPAVPITEVADGIWGMETGPAVIAGNGLFVTVDDSGNLI